MWVEARFSGLLLGQVWRQQCLLRVFTTATSLKPNVHCHWHITFFSGRIRVPGAGRDDGNIVGARCYLTQGVMMHPVLAASLMQRETLIPKIPLGCIWVSKKVLAFRPCLEDLLALELLSKPFPTRLSATLCGGSPEQGSPSAAPLCLCSLAAWKQRDAQPELEPLEPHFATVVSTLCQKTLLSCTKIHVSAEVFSTHFEIVLRRK